MWLNWLDQREIIINFNFPTISCLSTLLSSRNSSLMTWLRHAPWQRMSIQPERPFHFAGSSSFEDGISLALFAVTTLYRSLLSPWRDLKVRQKPALMNANTENASRESTKGRSEREREENLWRSPWHETITSWLKADVIAHQIICLVYTH